MKTKKVNLTNALYNKLDKLIDIIPNLDLENTNDGEVQIQYYKIKFKHINKLFKIGRVKFLPVIFSVKPNPFFNSFASIVKFIFFL